MQTKASIAVRCFLAATLFAMFANGVDAAEKTSRSAAIRKRAAAATARGEIRRTLGQKQVQLAQAEEEIEEPAPMRETEEAPPPAGKSMVDDYPNLQDPAVDGAMVDEHGHMMPMEEDGMGCSTCGDHGHMSNACAMPCGGCGHCNGCCLGGLFRWLSQDLTVFGGVQGFKNPVERGSNGSFGFNEGFNAGMGILPSYGLSGQVGFRAVQSNLSGAVINGANVDDTRQQYFFTTGLFRRADCHQFLQGGIAFDYLRDNYYADMNLTQVRSELAIVGPWRNEFGFWGAFNTSDDTGSGGRVTGGANDTWRTMDLYTFFWRGHFSDCAEARVFAGWAEEADGVFGGDSTITLSPRFGVQAAFMYVNPGNNGGANNFSQEAWGLSMNLVWYPGSRGMWANKSRNRPLFQVADNSVMILTR